MRETELLIIYCMLNRIELNFAQIFLQQSRRQAAAKAGIICLGGLWTHIIQHMGIDLLEQEAEPYELITLEHLQDICFIKKITPPYYFAQRSAHHFPLPNPNLVEVRSGNQQRNWKLRDAWHRAAIRAAEEVHGTQPYPIGDQEVWASDEEEEDKEEAAEETHQTGHFEETHQTDHSEEHIDTQHERGESSHQQIPRRTTVYERRSRQPHTESSTQHAWDEWNAQLHALTEAQASLQQQWTEEIVQRRSFEEEQRRSFEEQRRSFEEERAQRRSFEEEQRAQLAAIHAAQQAEYEQRRAFEEAQRAHWAYMQQYFGYPPPPPP